MKGGWERAHIYRLPSKEAGPHLQIWLEPTYTHLRRGGFGTICESTVGSNHRTSQWLRPRKWCVDNTEESATFHLPPHAELNSGDTRQRRPQLGYGSPQFLWRAERLMGDAGGVGHKNLAPPSVQQRTNYGRPVFSKKETCSSWRDSQANDISNRI